MLIAVLQLEDLVALKAAEEHLNNNGFKTKVAHFDELDSSEYQDWMTPENGGYIFYLEQEKYESAMKMLGDFFGYKG